MTQIMIAKVFYLNLKAFPNIFLKLFSIPFIKNIQRETQNFYDRLTKARRKFFLVQDKSSQLSLKLS